MERDRAKGAPPQEIRRTLPGDASDVQARDLEAAVLGTIVGCLYMPNGNPQPGPKFAYKLAWFARFQQHARMGRDFAMNCRCVEPGPGCAERAYTRRRNALTRCFKSPPKVS